MIAYTRFLSLLSDVPDCASLEEYIAECGGSVPTDRADEAVRLLTIIWTMGHDGLTIKSIAAACDLSVRRLAMTYGLKQRTVEDWAAGKASPPPAQLPLIAYACLSDYLAG